VAGEAEKKRQKRNAEIMQILQYGTLIAHVTLLSLFSSLFFFENKKLASLSACALLVVS